MRCVGGPSVANTALAGLGGPSGSQGRSTKDEETVGKALLQDSDTDDMPDITRQEAVSAPSEPVPQKSPEVTPYATCQCRHKLYRFETDGSILCEDCGYESMQCGKITVGYECRECLYYIV